MIFRIVFRLLVTHSVTNRRKTTTTKTPPDCSGRVKYQQSSGQASAGRSLLSASAITVEVIIISVRDFSLEYSSLTPRYKRVAY